jgi:hypothetical protein
MTAPQFRRYGSQPLVARPEFGASQCRRREQTGVDVADAPPHQPVLVDEKQDFFMGCRFAFRQPGKQGENFLAVLEIAAGGRSRPMYLPESHPSLHAARDILELGLCATQPDEPTSALSLDQGAQGFLQEGAAIIQTGEILSLRQKCIIESNCGTHRIAPCEMHQTIRV